jgi:hypothetical protein
LSGLLSACSGGSDDDDPKASPATTSSAAPATTPAPTPTPAATTQPPGENGVTLRMQDYAKYQDDPAVIEWTHINEALGASINQGSIVPGLEERTSKSVLRKFVSAVNVSKQNEYTVAAEGDVKVLSAETKGSRAKLTMCLWAPTTGIRDKNGKIVGDDEQVWFRQKAELSSSTGQWVLRTFDDTGTCPGGAPS